MTLLKVLKADMASPFKGFKFECQKWYHCPDFDTGDDECSNGFYATPIDGLHYAYRPGRRVFIAEVRGESRVFDCMKQRYEEMMLTDELTTDQIKQMALDAERRAGYRLSEVLFPINPLLLRKITATEADIILLKQWASVWDSVMASARASVMASVMASVWASVWDSVGDSVWDSVGGSVWAGARASARASVLDSVWAYIGSLFPAISNWVYVNHAPGVYPFQAGADLWRRGLVPIYFGGVWRLHSGAQAEIVWEEK